MTDYNAIAIRLLAHDDEALKRLGQLEGCDVPRGRFVAAEVEGEVVAAVPLDPKQPALADPFRHTAQLVNLLRLRARQLASTSP